MTTPVRGTNAQALYNQLIAKQAPATPADQAAPATAAVLERDTLLENAEALGAKREDLAAVLDTFDANKDGLDQQEFDGLFAKVLQPAVEAKAGQLSDNASQLVDCALAQIQETPQDLMGPLDQLDPAAVVKDFQGDQDAFKAAWTAVDRAKQSGLLSDAEAQALTNKLDQAWQADSTCKWAAFETNLGTQITQTLGTCPQSLDKLAKLGALYGAYSAANPGIQNQALGTVMPPSGAVGKLVDWSGQMGTNLAGQIAKAVAGVGDQAPSLEPIPDGATIAQQFQADQDAIKAAYGCYNQLDLLAKAGLVDPGLAAAQQQQLTQLVANNNQRKWGVFEANLAGSINAELAKPSPDPERLQQLAGLLGSYTDANHLMQSPELGTWTAKPPLKDRVWTPGPATQALAAALGAEAAPAEADAPAPGSASLPPDADVAYVQDTVVANASPADLAAYSPADRLQMLQILGGGAKTDANMAARATIAQSLLQADPTDTSWFDATEAGGNSVLEEGAGNYSVLARVVNAISPDDLRALPKATRDAMFPIIEQEGFLGAGKTAGERQAIEKLRASYR